MKLSKILFIFCLCIALITACSKAKGEKKMENSSENKNRPVVEMKTNLGTVKIEMWSDLTPKTVENFTALAMGQKEWTDRSGNMKKTNFYDGLIFHRVIRDFMIQGGCPLGNGTGGPGYSFQDECYDTSKADKIEGPISDEETAMMVFTEILAPYFRSVKTPDEKLLDLARQCQMQQSGKPLMENPVEFYMEKTGHKEPLYRKGKLLASVDYGTICMANSGPNTNGSQFFIVTKQDGCSWLNGKHTVFGKVIEGMDIVMKIQNVETGAQDRPVQDVKIESMRVIEK